MIALSVCGLVCVHYTHLKFYSFNMNIQIVEGSPEWDVLYSKNEYDMKLYEHAVGLFQAQKDVIGDFTMQHLLHLEKKVNQLLEGVNGLQ